MAQFRLYARQNSVPTRNAPANRSASSLALPSCGIPSRSPTTLRRPPRPRSPWGFERHPDRRLLVSGPSGLCSISLPNRQCPTQSGAQRLLALDQREEQARQLRVPWMPGRRNPRFSRVMTLFLDDELKPFLTGSKLTADPRCSEEALRQLKEAGDGVDTLRPP